MSDIEVSQELTLEDRLKAIAYQFIKLYERWSEDRQEAVKQRVELDELVEEFTQQVDGLRNLEKKIIGGVRDNIRIEAQNVAVTVGKTVHDAATLEMDATIRRLRSATHELEQLFSRYQMSLKESNFKKVAWAGLISVVAVFLTASFFPPQKVSPLTAEQVNMLVDGQMVQAVFPKLTKKEQERWWKLLNEAKFSEKGR